MGILRILAAIKGAKRRGGASVRIVVIEAGRDSLLIRDYLVNFRVKQICGGKGGRADNGVIRHGIGCNRHIRIEATHDGAGRIVGIARQDVAGVIDELPLPQPELVSEPQDFFQLSHGQPFRRRCRFLRSQWNLITGLVVQCRLPCPLRNGLWKSFRNDPGHHSGELAKNDRLQIGIPARLHPGIESGIISECRPAWPGIRR